MASTQALLLQLLLVALASASHHFGGTQTFTYKGRNPDGTHKVEFRNRATYDGCQFSHYWSCFSGNCGSNPSNVKGIIDRSNNAPRYNSQWCETETVRTRNVPSDKPFDLRAASCCWIPTRNGVSSWRLLTSVDLGNRSDTGKPNRSPDTAILPFLRVPQNCPRTYKLMAFDPDGDKVRCRYGNVRNVECSGCSQPSGFSLNQESCELHYNFSHANPRVYGFEMMVEDFPRRNIALHYSDGSRSSRSPLNARRKRDFFHPATTTAPTTHAPTPPTTTTDPWWRTTHWWWTTRSTPEITTPPPPTTTATTTTTHPWWWYNHWWWTTRPPSTPTRAPTPVYDPWWLLFPTTTPAPTTPEPTTTHPWWWWWTTTTTPEITTPPPPTTTPPTTTTTTTTTRHPWWWWWTTTTTPEITTPPPPTTTPPTTTTTTTTTRHPWWWTTPWRWVLRTPPPSHTTTPPTTTTLPSTTRHPWWWWTTTTTPEITTPPPATTAAPAPTTPWWWVLGTPPPSHTTTTTRPWWWWWTTTTTPEITTPPPPTATPPTTTNPPPTHPWWWYTTTTTTRPLPPRPTDPLSKLPLQFSLLVDPPAPSCQEGQYLPKLVHPTPRHGERIQAEVNKEVEIRVKAKATHASIHDIIMSGPLNISSHRAAHDEFIIRWTPLQDNLGDHFPICFAVESVVRSAAATTAAQVSHSHHHHFTPSSQSGIYQSEMRCVLVEVKVTEVVSHVTCGESTMTVAIEKSSFSGLHEDHLRLSDDTNTVCSLQRHSNTTHVIAVVPLNACGTQLEEDADNLYFKNEITTVEDRADLITRKHLLEVQFYCKYPKRGNVTMGFGVHRPNTTVWEKGFGTFTYQFEFFPDIQYRTMIQPNSYPLVYDIGSRIYMEIEATSALNNTELFVESCRASPYDNPNYQPTYSIIENGCTVDSTVQIHSPSHERQFKFSMEAFKFIGLHDQVYITCSVLMCEAGGHDTRCSQGCVNSTAWNGGHHHGHHHRRRRESAAQTLRHFISQGPLRLSRSTEETGSTVVNLNLNLVFIAGCLLAAVGMICAAVIYKTKTSRGKYQPLPAYEN